MVKEKQTLKINGLLLTKGWYKWDDKSEEGNINQPKTAVSGITFSKHSIQKTVIFLVLNC